MEIFKNSFTLAFQNEKLERKWETGQYSINFQCFRYKLYCSNLFLLLIIIENSINVSWINWVPHHILILSISLISSVFVELALYKRKSPKLINYLYLIVMMCNTFIILNKFVLQSHSQTRKIYFYTGITVSFEIILMFLNIPWYLQSPLILYPGIFFSPQIQEIKIFDFFYFPCILLIMVSIYFQQKFTQENFHNDRLREESLKKILQKLPAGVAILKNPPKKEKIDKLSMSTCEIPILKQKMSSSQLLFVNKKVQEIFETKNPTEIIEKILYLNRIKAPTILDSSEPVFSFQSFNHDNQSKESRNEVETNFQLNLLRGEKVLNFDIKLIHIVWGDYGQKSFDSTLFFMSDITNSIENSQLVEIDKYKDSLLASVTHDIKNPLINSIQFMKFSLQETNTSKIKSWVRKSINNSDLLLFLLNDILDQAQIKKKQLKMVISDFNLKQTIQEVVQLFSPQAEQQKTEIQFISHIDPHLMRISSDKMRIKQILINFVSNALQFTRSGRILIICHLLYYDQVQGQLIAAQHEDINKKVYYFSISIQDNGAGMNQETEQRLFRQFSTFNNDCNDNSRGVGLGLKISKQLIEHLGPQSDELIIVESKEMIGSRFTFLLNQRFDERQAVESRFNLLRLALNPEIYELSRNIKLIQPESRRQPSCDFSELKIEEDKQVRFQEYSLPDHGLKRRATNVVTDPLYIIIADDQPFNLIAIQYTMKKCLMEMPSEILTADDGIQAIKIVKTLCEGRNEAQILIIFDLNMPKMNGVCAALEIFQILKEQPEDTFKFKLVLSSAQHFNEIDYFKKQSNLHPPEKLFDYVIEKPIIDEQLKEIIEKFR